MRTRLVAAVALGVLSACGAGGDDRISEQAQPYYEAMVVQFQTEEVDELELDEPQAKCMSLRWIESIGREFVITSFVDGSAAPLQDEGLVRRLAAAAAACPSATGG